MQHNTMCVLHIYMQESVTESITFEDHAHLTSQYSDNRYCHLPSTDTLKSRTATGEYSKK
jgi:hypothetical protein